MLFDALSEALVEKKLEKRAQEVESKVKASSRRKRNHTDMSHAGSVLDFGKSLLEEVDTMDHHLASTTSKDVAGKTNPLQQLNFANYASISLKRQILRGDFEQVDQKRRRIKEVNTAQDSAQPKLQASKKANKRYGHSCYWFCPS